MSSKLEVAFTTSHYNFFEDGTFKPVDNSAIGWTWRWNGEVQRIEYNFENSKEPWMLLHPDIRAEEAYASWLAKSIVGAPGS